MNTLFEIQTPETLARIYLEFPVPGLDAAAEVLHAAYPGLSEESLVRILGLPTRSGHAGYSIAPAYPRGEAAS